MVSASKIAVNVWLDNWVPSRESNWHIQDIGQPWANSFVITYPANSYCSQANRLRQYTTVCHLMMVVWPKHVVAITSEEEEKNCCVDGPIIALLIVKIRLLWPVRNSFVPNNNSISLAFTASHEYSRNMCMTAQHLDTFNILRWV
jgi:hypothetical protein